MAHLHGTVEYMIDCYWVHIVALAGVPVMSVMELKIKLRDRCSIGVPYARPGM
jgi:hypothetical protein